MTPGALLTRLKSRLRDGLPARVQVPLKYYYQRARRTLEPEMALLLELVRAGERVVDVGGNRGVYAYAFAQLGAVVEVFEPNPACHQPLDAWARTRRDVHVHAVGLSSRGGHAQLHIPVDASGTEHDASASIEDNGFANARDQAIELRALDDFQLRGVALIKIDVEGHELSALEGAVQTLETSRPALLVEIEQRHLHRPMQDLFAFITGRGYVGYFLEGQRLTPLSRFVPARHQSMDNFDQGHGRYINNFLFLHATRLGEARFAPLLRRVTP